MSHQSNPEGARQAHRRGLALLGAAAVLGVGMAVWLGSWGADFRVRAAIIQGGGEAIERPHPRAGLVPTNENRGQVLFGRYCDSCHPGGEKNKGKDLLGPEFRRDFRTEGDIVQLVREGTCVMPAYNRFVLPDADVAEMAKFTLARAKAAASTDPTPPLPALDGQGIMNQKCDACHNTIDLPLNPRDPQLLYVVDTTMARCAGLTAQLRTELRTFLLEQQRR